ISKASILKDLMQNRSPRLSTDRTKRVAGIPAFANQSAASHITFDSPTGAPSLRIGNPIATMVECEGQYFLAVAQVNDIILGSSAIDSIVLDLLSDPGVKISYQILRLIAPNSDDGANGEYDWKWSFKFEHNSITNIPGRLIHPLNPTVSNRVPGELTYLFSSEVLIAVAASIDSQLTGNYYDDIPKVQRSDTFPYRSADPGASFLCTKCFPPVPIKTSNYQRILEHNGAHILFDKTILALDQPCGLCLRPFPMCTFTFLKSDGTASARQIDWTRSTCLNPVKFQMAAAMKSTKLSPCTNHLIPCPLQCGVVIWTYNILGHCR
ncbi:hypothetical protein B0H17DRAFT_894919, partial [Mycena rosella]